MGDYAVSSSENEILVKIWEYNPEWKVEILENGRLLSVTEKKDKDPLYLLCYEIPSYETMDSPGYPAPVRKLFSAKASSGDITRYHSHYRQLRAGNRGDHDPPQTVCFVLRLTVSRGATALGSGPYENPAGS